MIENIPDKNLLFLDIETVPQAKKWDDLDERTKKLWDKKTQHQRDENILPEEFYYERAGILAEFGKIICISCGIIVASNKLKITSFYSHNESKTLTGFNDLLTSDYFSNQIILCAHNGKEFDFPYISRRMIINQIELPNPLKNFGKKPWEIPHIDTMELWKFGDFKNFTSLDLLANSFGIESPKNDIDGSQVAEVYYKENDLERIKNYCESDVLTLANVFRKMQYKTLLSKY
ncbi:MAG: 3'-5' exonuclease [Flavobacteriales bacterium]|nr:3'-5' exonuclease [Flavobacteriales bacterium]